jgi:GNAT superfamily N-acetyltransferase
MASQEIRIACCRNDEVGAMQQFIDQYWRRGHILGRDEALLRWQYDPIRDRSGRFGGPTILLAKAGERIVGMLGLICADCNLRGVVVPAAWMAILLSIPEMRRQAVGLKLLGALPGMGFEAIFVLGINDKVKQIYRRLGYEILEDMPRWLGVSDLDGAASLLADCSASRDAGEIRKQCESCLVRVSNAPAQSGEIVVDEWHGPFDHTWDDAWAAQFAPRLVCTNRDAAYLNWRYVNHPTFRYSFHLARNGHGGRIAGLAVTRVEQIRNRPEKVLRVVEFVATPDAAKVLAESVVAAGREHGVTFADFYCTSRLAAEPLEAAGFRCQTGSSDVPNLPSRLQPLEGGEFRMQGAFLLSEALRAKTRLLLGCGEFYVTKSDGDMDRPN